MRHPLLAAAALLGLFPFITGCGHLAPSRAAGVATGYLSHQLCSAVFVSGRSPESAYREMIEPLTGSVALFMRHTVDRGSAEVRASFAGVADSRAVYRAPWGCTIVNDAAAIEARPAVTDNTPAPALLPPIADAGIVEPTDPDLKRALDRAFEEPLQAPHRWTQAIVVVHRDRIVAERYAPGIGIDTPLTGWSATKSVVNALIGILVRDGHLDVSGPAPIAAWSDPNDPRHAITIDQLLRMTSGLDMGQSLTSSAFTAFDPTAQMVFTEPDTAAVAQRAPLAHAPGMVWNYTNANTQLLSRIIRDHSGGTPAATLAYAHRELFDKLGMRHVTLEFDAAGTPIGASHMWASARDWARFGLLYLNDGVVGGQRILPPGWVDYSARHTPGAEDYGYGAGFWTNRGDGAGARYRIRAGMPADAFMARGSNGQYVVIIPSEQLVIARFGNSWTQRGDIESVNRLIVDVIKALKVGGST